MNASLALDETQDSLPLEWAVIQTKHCLPFRWGSALDGGALKDFSLIVAGSFSQEVHEVPSGVRELSQPLACL